MTEKKYPYIYECVFDTCVEKYFNTFSGFMLIYVRDGSGTFRLNDRRVEFSRGTTVIISCLDYLLKEATGSRVRLTVLNFSEEAFSGRLNEFFTIRSLPFCTDFKEDCDTPEAILDIIAANVDCDDKNNDIFVRNLSKDVLIYTIKNEYPDIITPVYDLKTESAILYIYRHFREQISAEEVAAYVHYSANYFYHSFQKNTGTTFQRFLCNLRIEFAMNLIRFTDLSISDICFECGYNSTQYFSTSFRKKFGKSPKNFINDKSIKRREDV